MKVCKIILCANLLALCPPAMAINKCTGADGKVSFQDGPCDASAKSATKVKTWEAAPPVAANDASGTQQTEAQRIESRVKASQTDRRKQELEWRLVPDALAAIAQQSKKCDADFKNLQDKKLLAKNNLAGATWEGSISSEMTALASLCNIKTAEARELHATLLKECRALTGCK
jgi:hypothetical protein